MSSEEAAAASIRLFPFMDVLGVSEPENPVDEERMGRLAEFASFFFDLAWATAS
jgi:hypothetical protein